VALIQLNARVQMCNKKVISSSIEELLALELLLHTDHGADVQQNRNSQWKRCTYLVLALHEHLIGVM